MRTETEKSFYPTDGALENTSSVRDQLLQSLRTSKQYRHAFAEEIVRTSIAAQIRAIREQRGMTRPALAELMGKTPSWIFRLEDPNEKPPTISTLLQVAEALDIDLHVSFESFSSLLDRLDRMTFKTLEVPDFDADLGCAERGSTKKQAARIGLMAPISMGSILSFPEQLVSRVSENVPRARRNKRVSSRKAA